MDLALQEKIILATIEEGGKEFPSAFSSDKIAENCQIPPLELYASFQTKTALLSAADDYLGQKLFAYANAALEVDETFEAFFSDLMTFQLRHPSWNGFWLNYSSIFPRFSSESEESPLEIPPALLQKLSRYLPKGSELSLDEAFRFLVRETVCFSRYVIYSEVPGNAHRLSVEAKLVYGGLSLFQKEKGR